MHVVLYHFLYHPLQTQLALTTQFPIKEVNSINNKMWAITLIQKFLDCVKASNNTVYQTTLCPQCWWCFLQGEEERSLKMKCGEFAIVMSNVFDKFLFFNDLQNNKTFNLYNVQTKHEKSLDSVGRNAPFYVLVHAAMVPVWNQEADALLCSLKCLL